jgi:hypothetical protein
LEALMEGLLRNTNTWVRQFRVVKIKHKLYFLSFLLGLDTREDFCGTKAFNSWLSANGTHTYAWISFSRGFLRWNHQAGLLKSK